MESNLQISRFLIREYVSRSFANGSSNNVETLIGSSVRRRCESLEYSVAGEVSIHWLCRPELIERSSLVHEFTEFIRSTAHIGLPCGVCLRVTTLTRVLVVRLGLTLRHVRADRFRDRARNSNSVPTPSSEDASSERRHCPLERDVCSVIFLRLY